jgi:predicted RND superfamily exporter protein
MLIGLLFCGAGLFAADETSDEAELKAFQEAQEVIQKEKTSVEERAQSIISLENEIVNVKAKYPGKTLDEALAKWREDIRKKTDPVQRFSEYEWMKRVETAVNKVKESTKAATAEAAITAEKAAVTAAKAK